MSFSSYDCLLPTGFVVPVGASKSATFADLKNELWKLASKLPLFRTLEKPESYGLKGVNLLAELVDFDDDQNVAASRLFRPILKVVKRQGDKADQKFNLEIGTLINKRLSDFDSMNNPEINSFRRDVIGICQEAIDGRTRGGERQMELYKYPPRIDEEPFPKHIKDKLGDDKSIFIKVKIPAIPGSSDGEMEFRLKTPIEATATQLVLQILIKKTRNDAKGKALQDSFVLKILGRDEYLLGGYRLEQYKCVRQALIKGYDPKSVQDVLILELRERKALLAGTIVERTTLKRPPAEDSRHKNGPTDMLWYSPNGNKPFVIKICDAKEVLRNSAAASKLFGIGVRCGLYLGDNQICQEEVTRYVHHAPNGELIWDNSIEFKKDIKDLPRNVRLCLSIHGVWVNPLKLKKKSGKLRNEFPIAWINIAAFDYKGFLRTGKQVLQTWAYKSELDDLLNPLGTTMINPDNSPPLLTVEFETFERDIKYPDLENIGRKTADGAPRVHPHQDVDRKSELMEVESIIQTDPLYKLSSRNMELLRKYRYEQKNKAVALPKCLRAIDYSSFEYANEVSDMLRLWATLSPEDSLDLLDAGFADSMIRSYAVQCLSVMSDDKLLAYLMQLIQVLKYECYLDCELSRFLLRRALKNQRVGHFFFWYLRSEMHLPEACIRFGLLLEAYCRGCGSHLQELAKQVSSMSELVFIADSVKPKALNKQSKVKLAQDSLAQQQLGDFVLPLDPTFRVKSVECVRVMDSKKLPLWLKFTSNDLHELHIIFKSGDDLRQDMLTLQLIRLMDQLWQSNGLDLQMNAYGCLSTGDFVGMLEVVMNSRTIAEIQGGARAAMADDPLYKWLHKMNESEEQYAKAVESFLLSCAGYCVATYVLGIADRHNGNIMVTKTGQLFHIDFGHFLGNWKSKLGVKRERVKFILTPDFVYALSNGKGQESDQFRRFKEVSKRAYLIVRKHANLFINLLNMMLCTGIPELSSHEDVFYLRDTLCLNMSEEDAGEAFMTEIDIALRDSWSVRLNWAAHVIAHG